MNRYEAYKDSGVDWIGEIPEGWELKKLKFICDVYNGDSLNENQKKQYSSANHSHLPYISSKDIDVNFSTVNYENGLRIPAGKYFKVATKFSTLLCIEGGSAGRKITYLNQDVSFVNKLACFKSYNGINSMYVYYSLKGVAFRTQFFNSLTGLIGGVSISNIKNFCLTFPPLSEQTAIAEFLNDKTAKIDQTIAIRQKEIELLKERRQILIQQAVTKGLDNTVKFKESGVDWIGKIPEHWEVRRLKYVFKILKRIAGREGYNILSITQKGIKVKNISSGEGQIAADYSNYQFCNKGEFAMNHMDLLTGWVDISQFNGVISPDYRVFESILFESDNNYLLRLLQQCYINKAFYANGQGVSMLGRWRFPTENFNNFSFPIPPVDEQTQIVSYLEKIEEKISKAISIKEQEIEKLKEYKTVLIDNVVTGKVKIDYF